VILQGDTTRRVTVPLPRSLQELQYHAKRHFARDVPHARMFHQGEAHIHHDHHVKKLRDGDVVVVENIPKGIPEAPNLTTHQIDYTPHEMDPRPPPRQARTPEPGLKFDGVTSYNVDYIKHPVGARKPIYPPRSGWVTGRPGGTTGRSMYATHYPWHDAEPRRALEPPSGMPLDGAPFDGVTSYKVDYVKHPIRPRSTPMRPQQRGDPAPFDATTTYFNDFQKHPSARTAPARPHVATLRPEGGPFDGSTEYGREYVELKMESRPLVHIEPELRRFPTNRSPSVPPGRRM